MGELLVELLPFAVGLAITPTAIATVILMLGSTQPVANATAFAAPFAVLYALLAGVVLVATGAATGPLLDDGDKAQASLVIGVVLLLVGVASVVRARRPRAAGRAGLLDRLDAVHPPMAFAIGLALALLNPNVPILLGGLATVAAADASDVARAVGAAFLVLGSEVGLVVPIAWYRLSPERAARGLARVKAWLARHTLAVDLVVLFGFGGLFALRGLSGL